MFGTEKPLNGLNPKLRAFAKKLNKLVKGHETMAYETARIQFWSDLSVSSSPFPFRFERQEAIGFKENRYYSIAPLETDVHLELLNELEEILG
jgi:protein tyrosine phosphatase